MSAVEHKDSPRTSKDNIHTCHLNKNKNNPFFFGMHRCLRLRAPRGYYLCNVWIRLYFLGKKEWYATYSQRKGCAWTLSIHANKSVVSGGW